MLAITRSQIESFFYLVCMLVSFLLTVWVCVEYNKNEDVIEVAYQKFDLREDNSPYPSISLCVMDAYRKSSLNKEGNQNTNLTAYTDFLNGNLWFKEMLEVDYHSVTIDVRDYLISTCMTTTAHSECHPIDKIEPMVLAGPLGATKCFSFHHTLSLDKTTTNEKDTSHVDHVHLDEVMISINSSLFPNGIRPSSGQFIIMFHYPFQLIRSIYTTFLNWPSRDQGSSKYYAMQFYMKSVEIIKRRKDGSEDCSESKNYDEEVQEIIMEFVGCQPPFWTSKYFHPPCHSKRQLKDIFKYHKAALFQDYAVKKFDPPCVEIKKIDISFEDKSGEENKDNFNNAFYKRFEEKAGGLDNWFLIHMHFWSILDFKEIKQIKAYPFQSLIGNASGYIGFLVGVSVSELPYFIFWLCVKIKKLVRYSNARLNEKGKEGERLPSRVTYVEPSQSLHEGYEIQDHFHRIELYMHNKVFDLQTQIKELKNIVEKDDT